MEGASNLLPNLVQILYTNLSSLKKWSSVGHCFFICSLSLYFFNIHIIYNRYVYVYIYIYLFIYILHFGANKIYGWAIRITSLHQLVGPKKTWYPFAPAQANTRPYSFTPPKYNNYTNIYIYIYIYIWLVVLTILKNISQLGLSFQIYGKKNVPNHQSDIYIYIYIYIWVFFERFNNPVTNWKRGTGPQSAERASAWVYRAPNYNWRPTAKIVKPKEASKSLSWSHQVAGSPACKKLNFEWLCINCSSHSSPKTHPTNKKTEGLVSLVEWLGNCHDQLIVFSLWNRNSKAQINCVVGWFTVGIEVFLHQMRFFTTHQSTHPGIVQCGPQDLFPRWNPSQTGGWKKSKQTWEP